MSFVKIKFAGGEFIQVPRPFTIGMCDVFQGTETIHANALDFVRHAHLVKRVAGVFSEEVKPTRVRAMARVSTMETHDLVRVLEFSNYFCHDMILDMAASTLANRVSRMSTAEIAMVFDIDTSSNEYIPSHNILRRVTMFKN